MIMMIAAIVMAILVPILARIFYFSLSRKREYLADATSARLTRYPEGLARALDKISTASHSSKGEYANKITSPMYIINPLASKSKSKGKVGLFSTHPPTEERIKILRGISGGAHFAEYQKSYQSISGEKKPLFSENSIKEDDSIGIRAPEKENKTQKQKTREVGDMLRMLNNYAFIACACGLKIKVPPGFKQKTINCPKCHTTHEIPMVELTAAAEALKDV